MEDYRKKTERSRPGELGEIFRSELEGAKGKEIPEGLRWGRMATGEPRELDPIGVARRAALRLGECGTFPRGKLALIYPSGHRQELGAHQCGSRFCPRCGKRRSIRLGESLARAAADIQKCGFGWDRTRFCTFTIPNRENAAEGIAEVSEAWHRMLANRKFGRLVAGGYRCFEVKAGKDGKWNIHLHAILFLWSPGIPYDVLRQAWDTAAKAPAGQTFNQRFDEIRKLAKPRPGETRAAAAVRYLVKYIAKFEDIESARNAPGGLLHLAAALDGRRLFGAWGLGAIARRKARHEFPEWTIQANRAVDGYRFNNEFPARAEIVIGANVEPVPIPSPAGPANLDEFPEQIEAKDWKIRDVRLKNPFHAHPDRHLLPNSQKTLKDWLGYQEQKRKALDRLKEESGGTRAFRRARKLWLLAHPAPRIPEAFRWKAFWTSAPKAWTQDAETLLGQRVTGNMGAALWSRIKPDERVGITDTTDTRQFWQLMANSVRAAHRTIGERLGRLFRLDQRVEYLSKFPEHLRRGITQEVDPWQDWVEGVR